MSPVDKNRANPPPERRSQTRAPTVLRPALIEAADFAGFCLVRDLSAKGLRGKVYTTFSQQEPVTIRFTTETQVTGKVAWCDGEFIGAHFDKPINVPTLLARLGQREVCGKINRPLRLPLHSVGSLLAEGRRLHVKLRDISQKGAKTFGPILPVGEKVIIELEGLAPRNALVRWSERGLTGLEFVQSLPFAELAEWAVYEQIISPFDANGSPQIGLALVEAAALNPREGPKR